MPSPLREFIHCLIQLFLETPQQKFIIAYLCSQSLRSTIWYCSRSPPFIGVTKIGPFASSLTTSPCREEVAKSYMWGYMFSVDYGLVSLGHTLSHLQCTLDIRIMKLTTNPFRPAMTSPTNVSLQNTDASQDCSCTSKNLTKWRISAHEGSCKPQELEEKQKKESREEEHGRRPKGEVEKEKRGGGKRRENISQVELTWKNLQGCPYKLFY